MSEPVPGPVGPATEFNEAVRKLRAVAQEATQPQPLRADTDLATAVLTEHLRQSCAKLLAGMLGAPR
jgi:hypothetical protein